MNPITNMGKAPKVRSPREVTDVFSKLSKLENGSDESFAKNLTSKKNMAQAFIFLHPELKHKL